MQHSKNQACHTQRQIKDCFRNLHTFLEEEEEVRETALGGGRGASQIMKEKMEALNSDIAALSETIQATEEELRARGPTSHSCKSSRLQWKGCGSASCRKIHSFLELRDVAKTHRQSGLPHLEQAVEDPNTVGRRLIRCEHGQCEVWGEMTPS